MARLPSWIKLISMKYNKQDNCMDYKMSVIRNCDNCGNKDCFSRKENPGIMHESPPCTGWELGGI